MVSTRHLRLDLIYSISNFRKWMYWVTPFHYLINALVGQGVYLYMHKVPLCLIDALCVQSSAINRSIALRRRSSLSYLRAACRAANTWPATSRARVVTFWTRLPQAHASSARLGRRMSSFQQGFTSSTASIGGIWVSIIVSKSAPPLLE